MWAAIVGGLLMGVAVYQLLKGGMLQPKQPQAIRVDWEMDDSGELTYRWSPVESGTP